ncbi:IS1595 family transposase [Cohnella hashimotonis]|uniref:IS1595 family transposase n=1 Tax=Cohnella hashimotonis TaxID=2826895 RepID=A0ABT6TUB2_9BACL|nr:IS1595 family transposase [Cohnella hashimotonis]MDI4650405.1 IS1595 family transposase [Cohnella hashimotonis]
MIGLHSLREKMPVFQEEACEFALFKAKWPNGYRCPRCDGAAFYLVASRRKSLYECRVCHHQTSLTAGTIMEGTRTPLVKWFSALYLMQTGISATLLAEVIQVTYKTAWLINHKLRHAIQVCDESRPLKGDLQLYGDFYARPVMSGVFDPPDQRDQPAVVGASIDPESGEVAEVKIKRVPPNEFRRRLFGVDSFGTFLWRHVTDAKSEIQSIEIVKQSDSEGVTELGLIWRGVIGWLARTFGGIGPKHLQAYLDEYCFRINARPNSFEMLLSLCGLTQTVTLGDLVNKKKAVRSVRWSGLANYRQHKNAFQVS